MTVKEVFESVLIELDKVASPTMLLSDFNYFLNKATYQYLNKKYGVFNPTESHYYSTLNNETEKMNYVKEIEHNNLILKATPQPLDK